MHGSQLKAVWLLLLGAVTSTSVVLTGRSTSLDAPPPSPAAPTTLAVQYSGTLAPRVFRPAVELVLDSSRSMKAPLQGRTRLDQARDVVSRVLDQFPDEMHVGLRLYGHWGAWRLRRDNPKAGRIPRDDPRLNEDSDLVVPIGPLDDARRGRMDEWLRWCKPRGKTPLIYSLEQSTADFPHDLRAPRIVVLVSDGQETCGGELESLRKKLGQSEHGLMIHVVGFAVDETEAHSQLQDIAEMAGGVYYTAEDASGLADAIMSAVQQVGFEVFDTLGNRAAGGLLNGPPIDIRPGRYRVRIAGGGTFLPIDLAMGQTLSLSLDEQGRLTSPDAAADARPY